VFDAQLGAEPVERVRARRRAPAQVEQAVANSIPLVLVARIHGDPKARSVGMVRMRIGQARRRSRRPRLRGTIGSSPMESASRSSRDTGRALRSATATASCAGGSVRRENASLDRFLFRLTLQPVRRMAAIRDAVALAPSPRRSNRWCARGSVQIICAFVGKTASQVN
jgi:hypothetical protein